MKAIAHLGPSIFPRDEQLIRNTLNTVMDIQFMDLDIEKGVLFFQYQNLLALDLLERKLSEIGYPIVSYSYPDRRPSNFNGDDTDYGPLA